MKGWDYIWQHPEIILGWLLVVIGIITGAVWSVKVLTAKFKYTYEKEKDKAWQEEHARRIKAEKTCNAAIDVAQQMSKNYRIALLTLRRVEKTRINQQKVD